METRPRTTKVRILLVDDHPVLRHGLSRLINAEPDLTVCGEAPDAASAIEAVERSQPDLIVLDLALGDRDGLELIKDIRGRGWRTLILVLSMYNESVYAERVLRAGAQGYVMKHEAPENVLTGIRKVMDGQVYVSEEMQQLVLHGVVDGQARFGVDPSDRLSDRELEVFRLVGSGHSTRDIADQLHLSVKTIESYRAHIKTKLALETAAELAQRAALWVREISGA